jgi:Tfp pilus assembly protein PilF
MLSGDLNAQANQLGEAGAAYLKVIMFHEDKDLKPLALSKYIRVLEQQGNQSEAEKYRQQLKSEFPDWKNPAK